MSDRLTIVGAPSSAGAYAPGQEKAPDALRAIGLPERLSARGVTVDDRGDVPGFRWRVDRASPRAMNAGIAAAVARATAERVAAALAENSAVLVLGGDCTVELGTVAGALRDTDGVGVVYIDLDPELAALGPRVPMLRPDQVLFFVHDNVEPFERRLIEELGIAEVPLADVAADPPGAAEAVAGGWARRFERLLVHLDVDVLDYTERLRTEVGTVFVRLTTVPTAASRRPPPSGSSGAEGRARRSRAPPERCSLPAQGPNITVPSSPALAACQEKQRHGATPPRIHPPRSTSSVQIREATADDWASIWPFFREIVAAGETYPYDPAIGAEQGRAMWMLPPPGRTVVAIDDDGTVVGSAKMNPNRDGPGSHVASASFMVDPRHAGRGVGRALGEHALAWARSNGYRAMQFNAVVQTNTRAVALWRSLGFEVIGTVPEAFRHPTLGYVGLHIMHRRL